jgi:hypothetical protein
MYVFLLFLAYFSFVFLQYMIATGLELTPNEDNALVFYFGPMIYSPKLGVQDFMALELQNGFAVLYVDYGTGTVRLDHKQIKLTDGKSHRIDILWTKTVRAFVISI